MAQEGFSAFIARQPETFRRRARRGVPVEHRWEAWKAVVRLDDRAQPGLYQELLQLENQWTRLIEIDIPRTFPDIPLFDKEQQYSLLRVLNAFANFDPTVGYCQGMNFVAGLLLLVAQNGDFRESPRLEKEEEAFWMLVTLMTDCRLSGFYRRHFPLLRRYLWAFDKLMSQHLPNLQEHFVEEGVQHAVYLHQWFLTLFINCLPMDMVLVFWDAIVCGGRGFEAMLPITVALLQALEDVLLSLQFEDIVRFFKTMRIGEDDIDGAFIGRFVIAKCHGISLSPSIKKRLRAPFGDESCPSPLATPGPGEDKEEFILTPARKQKEHEFVQEGNAEDPSEQPWLFRTYLRQFTEIRRDLPDLPLSSWWGDARENFGQRVGLGLQMRERMVEPPERQLGQRA